MGYLQTHRGLVSERTTIPATSALRGRVYELRYDSKTATNTKYIVLGINIYPKAGGKSKQLLHCLDLDEIPVAEVRKLIRGASDIATGWKSGLEHQQLIIEGRSTAVYDNQLKKLSKKFPGIYKTFKLNKITKFELTNYDFLSIADTKTKKKFGIVDED
jgi:hypothetical protein